MPKIRNKPFWAKTLPKINQFNSRINRRTISRKQRRSKDKRMKSSIRLSKFWKKTTSCLCWQSSTITICPRKSKINPWFPSWPPNSFHCSKSSKIGKLLFLWMMIAGLLCIMQSRPMMLRLRPGWSKREIRISRTISATLPCSRHWD